MTEYRPQLILRRADLSDLPALDLPDGYTLHRCYRVFTDDERAGIATVLGASFPDMAWTPDRVDGTFIGDELCTATLYLRHRESGEIAATATARLDPSFPDTGYVHWVGAHPAHRGKRLGYFASLAVLHEFVAQGLRGAVLTTDDERTPAIKTYFALGFVPLMSHGSHPARWDAVHAALPT